MVVALSKSRSARDLITVDIIPVVSNRNRTGWKNLLIIAGLHEDRSLGERSCISCIARTMPNIAHLHDDVLLLVLTWRIDRFPGRPRSYALPLGQGYVLRPPNGWDGASRQQSIARHPHSVNLQL